MEPFSSSGDDVSIEVWVVTRSKAPGIDGFHGDRLRVRVGSPPEDGRANREAGEILSSALGVSVRLARGMAARSKVFLAAGLSVEEVRDRLGLNSP